MNYTLNQLRIFQQVVQEGSITRAAEALHLTQPAVSIQLKNFQEQFDLPLVEVIHKRVYVTDFGREIAAAVETILNGVQAINHRLHTHKGQLAGRLKLSVVSTGKYVAPYFIAGFIRQQPGVELRMDVTNKAQVLKSLEQNEVDFSLVSVLPDKLQVEKVALMQNKLYVVGNTAERFSRETYDKTIFERIPIIYREPGSGTRLVMEEFIRKNRLPVTKKMELTSNEAVKQAVMAGLGYSIMPLIGLKNELMNKQLQIIPVKGFPIKSTWYLIWLPEKKLTPVAAAYLDYLKKEKQRVVRETFDWFETY
ncbi:MAG TPA: LysR family transcriptional regulator [Lacibacter sp.]|nr:LysR family transcriptional regulator [Lacibacter sp.]HMO88474.1 LysR family transcriptional regulator [Lacibacter sp.]HMP86392.1 LysR family transcriptional regulator [Lacibacter sp.]